MTSRDDDTWEPNEDETVDLPSRGPRPHTTDIPDRIGEFRIVQVLGQGGMGTVYEAFQESMQRKVALKVMNLSMGVSGEARQRFEREAWIGGRLHHPNIVTAHSQGVEGTCQYIAMELIEGPSLHELIREQKAAAESSGPVRRSERDRIRMIVELFVGVADALQQAHAQGIVHRDIKPPNLLLTGDSKRMLISDFGLARDKSAPGLTRQGDFLGTIRYMSPEQLLAHRMDVDHRSDIWSFGVSLYEAVTHDLPFSAPSEEGFIAAISTKDPKLARRANPAVSRDLETILMTCLDRDPEGRYQDCADLRDDLRRFLDGEPVLARRPGSIRRLGRRVRRRQREAIGAVAGIVFLGITFWFGQAYLAGRAEYERLIEVLERAHDEGRNPGDLDSSWPMLEARLRREIEKAPRGEVGILAMRSAVIPRAWLEARFGLVEDPPMLFLSRDLFVQHQSGQYVVIVFEGSWDNGPWNEVGWCTAPLVKSPPLVASNSLNRVITRGSGLREGPHVLQMRADIHGFVGRADRMADLEGLCVSYGEGFDAADGAGARLAEAQDLELVFEESRELDALEVYLFDRWPDDFPREVELAELERSDAPFEIDLVRLVLAKVPQPGGSAFTLAWPDTPETLTEEQREGADLYLSMFESISVTPASGQGAGDRVLCGVELHGRVDVAHPGPVAARVSVNLRGRGDSLYTSRFTLVPGDPDTGQGPVLGLNNFFLTIPGERSERYFCLAEPYRGPEMLSKIEFAEDMPHDGEYRAVVRFEASREVARESRQLDCYVGTTIEYEVPLSIVTVQGRPLD